MKTNIIRAGGRGLLGRVLADYFAVKGMLMRDRLEFQSPMGILGRSADCLFLTSYRRRFLVRRNEALRQLAEADRSATQPKSWGGSSFGIC